MSPASLSNTRATGVHLFAFGRKGYAYAASNLIVSLRHYGWKGYIGLHVSQDIRKFVSVEADAQCDVIILPDVAYMRQGKVDPGWFKCNMAQWMPKGDNVYLDVDAVCVADITKVVDTLTKDGRNYITGLIAKGGEKDTIRYYEWASKEQVKQKHGLSEDATYYALQTSWAFLRTDTQDTFFDRVAQAHDLWDVSELKQKWGGCLPDELIYSAVCSERGYDPSVPFAPVFFGDEKIKMDAVKERHQLLSLYGQGRGKTAVPRQYIHAYDNELYNIQRSCGRLHQLKSPFILRDKWVNFTR